MEAAVTLLMVVTYAREYPKSSLGGKDARSVGSGSRGGVKGLGFRTRGRRVWVFQVLDRSFVYESHGHAPPELNHGSPNNPCAGSR